jgi:hypothetical protein
MGLGRANSLAHTATVRNKCRILALPETARQGQLVEGKIVRS